MDWVEGVPVSELPSFKLTDAVASYLADQFATMMRALKQAGIAHGDLEFSNILISGFDLKLVDYDSMFVAELLKLGSPELGNPGFQHPKRRATDYAPYLDNFSAWLIHFLLRNLSLNPNLFELAALCLQEERQGTAEHVTLRSLESHPDSLVRKMGSLLRHLTERPLHLIPDLHPDESLATLISRDSRDLHKPGGLFKRKPKP